MPGLMYMGMRKRIENKMRFESVKWILFLMVSLNFLCPAHSQNATDGKQAQINYIKFGHSAGMCDGYCYNEAMITKDRIITTQLAWKKAGRDSSEFPTKTDTTVIRPNHWSRLVAAADIVKFFNLPETIGCPDCDDGGAQWVEISYQNKSHKVSFEAGKTIDDMAALQKELRSKE